MMKTHTHTHKIPKRILKKKGTINLNWNKNPPKERRERHRERDCANLMARQKLDR